MYLEQRREQGIVSPRCLLWWHDSYFERSNFKKPNAVIREFLKYLPGLRNDGIVFINSSQPVFAKKYLKKHGRSDIDTFLSRKACVIPNTCDIPWQWEKKKASDSKPFAPPQSQYNKTFFRDLGLPKALREKGYKMQDAVFLLQHTRIVPRKRIETAIEFAFKMAEKFKQKKKRKCMVLLVSGHSGDEQEAYREKLEEYFETQNRHNKELDVLFYMSEHIIYPTREVIVDRKFYKFAEIPSIIAAHGGMGTYFSEVEGFGNNLLEMMSQGLPVAINKYDVYLSDLEHLGFKLPATENWDLTDEFMEACYKLLTNYRVRNKLVQHNLSVLQKKLNNNVIAAKLEPLIKNMYLYQ
jgi:glycosyltransferase involved in cell wall biosynthesis